VNLNKISILKSSSAKIFTIIVCIALTCVASFWSLSVLESDGTIAPAEAEGRLSANAVISNSDQELRARLTNVFVHKILLDERRSTAYIDDGGKERMFAVGDALAGGIVVSAIFENHVVLTFNNVSLVVNVKPNTSPRPLVDTGSNKSDLAAAAIVNGSPAPAKLQSRPDSATPIPVNDGSWVIPSQRGKNFVGNISSSDATKSPF
jgi:hypothetical protein